MRGASLCPTSIRALLQSWYVLVQVPTRGVQRATTQVNITIDASRLTEERWAAHSVGQSYV